jgi:hypothetical protein
MSKNNDSGHDKNVVNFDTELIYLTGYGAVYNPSNVNIQLSSLNEQAAIARTVMNMVNDLQLKIATPLPCATWHLRILKN